METKSPIFKTTVAAGKTPGAVRACELLLRKFLSEELVSGQPLREAELAAEFNVNHPAVREALNQAVGWGVVEYAPYRGHRIRNFTLGDLRDWYELREGVEPIAARNLAENGSLKELRHLDELVAAESAALKRGDIEALIRCDREFHLALINGSGNQRFKSPGTLCFFSVVFNLDLRARSADEYRSCGGRGESGEVVSPAEFYLEKSRRPLDFKLELCRILRRGDGEAAETHTRAFVRWALEEVKKQIALHGGTEVPLSRLG